MNCAVKLIYEAVQKTSVILSPMEKEIKYGSAKLGDLKGECWLCGCTTTHGFKRDIVIKDTFQNKDMAKAPWSAVCCDHCAWALSFMSMRNYSIIATKTKFEHPSRTRMKEVLLSPPDPPFVICVAESGQLWLHFKAKVNLSNDRFTIRMDKFDVIVNQTRFKILLASIENLYRVFTKDEILTGNYQSHRIKEFGLSEWETEEENIRGLRKSGIFQLALFVARREEE